jgi:hypothetical protein
LTAIAVGYILSPFNEGCRTVAHYTLSGSSSLPAKISLSLTFEREVMMPPTLKQKYYAFISHSHQDESWAKQLYEDLINKKGIPKEGLFLDRPTMKAGDLWREQLRAALDASSYLVVFWSSHAKESEWVNYELDHFENQINTPGAELIKVHQRMIFVSLDLVNKVYEGIQMIDDLKKAKAYDPKNPSIAPFLQQKQALWDDLVENIHQTITTNDITIPISLLICSTTSDQLNNEIDFSKVPAFADFTESLDDLLGNTIKIGTKAELIARYGLKRSDWKPIVGNDSTVRALLDKLKDQINSLDKSPKIRWQPADDSFWTDPDEAILIAERLARELAVVVIDPISLYDPKVHRRFAVLKDNGCFDNENAVVLVLSPFSMPLPNLGFRELIRRVATLVFNDYYQPGIRKIPYARCSVNFGDDLAMTRPVLATITNHFYQNQTPRSPIQTSMGGQAG